MCIIDTEGISGKGLGPGTPEKKAFQGVDRALLIMIYGNSVL